MIGESDTTRARPTTQTWLSKYGKGVASNLVLNTKIKPRAYIYDAFETVDAWINVYGTLHVTGGLTSDVTAGFTFSYAAGRHQTQLLSDNCRARVTIQDGLIGLGESRVWVCGDASMNRYYGVAIYRDLIRQSVEIIRGSSSISVERFERTTATVNNGDVFEVWYDRPNSTVRVYKNGAEVCSKYFTPNDIPHGKGNRWCGVVLAADWSLDVGANFADFTAWDVDAPVPHIYDPFDGTTVSPHWIRMNNNVAIHPHLFQPSSLGPNNVFFSKAAVLWDDEMDTNSVKVVFNAINIGFGKYVVVLCSNATMTNWVGVQFETGLIFNMVRTVKGTGPTTYTAQGETAWELSSTGTVFTVTYDEITNKVSLYKGAVVAGSAAIIDWTVSGVTPAVNHRYVGQIWETSLLSAGVEPSSFEAYNVTATAPLP